MREDVKKEDLEKLLTIEKLPSKFHELIEAYLCYNFIDKEEEKNLRKLFRYFDRNEKNRLVENDFRYAFDANNIEYNDEDIKRIMEILDSDGNNSIEYQEFLRGICDKEALHSDENLKSVFEAIDEDRKEYINVQDIKNFIFKKKEIEDNKFLDYLNRIGMNLSSQLKYDEFVDIIRGKKLVTFIKPKTKSEQDEQDEKNKEDINQTEETKNDA
jgi:Ca2+-binding EF-hand superfamily protein